LINASIQLKSCVLIYELVIY